MNTTNTAPLWKDCLIAALVLAALPILCFFAKISFTSVNLMLKPLAFGTVLGLAAAAAARLTGKRILPVIVMAAALLLWLVLPDKTASVMIGCSAVCAVGSVPFISKTIASLGKKN